MKYIFLIIIIAFGFGCSTVQKDSIVSLPQGEKVPTIEEAASTPVPQGNPPKDIEVGAVKLNPVEYYTTQKEREIIKRAEAKLNEVKSSQCFRDFIAARNMIETQGKTSKQVSDHIASLSGLVDVSMYFSRFSSAVAYRQPPELKINLNRKYFYESLPLCDWVSTILHESLHALANYEHSYKWTPERIYSVPYSANEAVDACCK